MDTNNTVNEIKLQDIYFSNIRFNQVRGTNGNIKLDIKHKFEVAKSNDKKSVKLTIITTVSSSDMRIDIEIHSVGIFMVEDNDKLSDNMPQIMVNTLYPFVRSEIQLLTTQPGLLPIMLPLGTPRINKEPVIGSNGSSTPSDDSFFA